MSSQDERISLSFSAVAAKVADIIVSSRTHPSVRPGAINRRFNIETLAPFSEQKGDTRTLTIEIYLDACAPGSPPGWHVEQKRTLLERWHFQHEVSSERSLEVPVVYKRAVRVPLLVPSSLVAHWPMLRHCTGYIFPLTLLFAAHIACAPFDVSGARRTLLFACSPRCGVLDASGDRLRDWWLRDI